MLLILSRKPVFLKGLSHPLLTLTRALNLSGRNKHKSLVLF